MTFDETPKNEFRRRPGQLQQEAGSLSPGIGVVVACGVGPRQLFTPAEMAAQGSGSWQLSSGSWQEIRGSWQLSPGSSQKSPGSQI